MTKIKGGKETIPYFKTLSHQNSNAGESFQQQENLNSSGKLVANLYNIQKPQNPQVKNTPQLNNFNKTSKRCHFLP
ncbi:MAG: hypothetical protein K9M75_08125 [Phycisphaerae bacterium]|nr:hypothetical protein [Phycisphaerae bacterium]